MTPLQSISLYKLLANHKLFNKTINFDLKRIKLVLKKLNHPERKLNNVINILGSSGKFTTLHSLKCFIEYNNQTATAFISPSIKTISERFWMGDRYLTNKEIRYSIKIIEEEKIPLTIFEVLTVIFILNASKQDVSYKDLFYEAKHSWPAGWLSGWLAGWLTGWLARSGIQQDLFYKGFVLQEFHKHDFSILLTAEKVKDNCGYVSLLRI